MSLLSLAIFLSPSRTLSVTLSPAIPLTSFDYPNFLPVYSSLVTLEDLHMNKNHAATAPGEAAQVSFQPINEKTIEKVTKEQEKERAKANKA